MRERAAWRRSCASVLLCALLLCAQQRCALCTGQAGRRVPELPQPREPL